MKILVLISALLISSLFCEKTYAQITVSVNFASQPIWGPVGYDYVDYYYLPDIDAYYYVSTRQYIYLYNGRWISRSYLPSRYRNYNMYLARKVVINEPKPYLHDKDYKNRYASTKEYSNQPSIRDSHDSRYFANRNHPQHVLKNESNRIRNNDQGNVNGKNKQGHINKKSKRGGKH